MPSINRSHDDLALIASGLRQALLADELLGLLAAGFEVDLNITSLSPGARQALHELAADLEAVAQEHNGEDDPSPGAEDRLLTERLTNLAEFRRILARAKSLDEADWWCDLNERLIHAVEDA